MSESASEDELPMNSALKERFMIQQKFLLTVEWLYSSALHFNNPDIDNKDLLMTSKKWSYLIFGFYSKHYDYWLERLTIIGNFHQEDCQHLAETLPRELLNVKDRISFEEIVNKFVRWRDAEKLKRQRMKQKLENSSKSTCKHCHGTSTS